jgi:hypothetical protein
VRVLPTLSLFRGDQSEHNAGQLAAGVAGGRIDNIYRDGSELNVPGLKAAGSRFVEGDVGDLGALEVFGLFDALIECSAESSARAESVGGTAYMFGDASAISGAAVTGSLPWRLP